MRSNRWSSLGAMAAVVAIATLAAGYSFGDDPKPPTVKPASAQVVEQAEPTDRIILAFRQDVRYLVPSGHETLRVDIAKAKQADPDLITGTLTIGSEGIKLSRFLPLLGRPGPGGVLPLDSHGLEFLSPGDPLKLMKPKTQLETEGVAGWAPDGRSLYTIAADRSAVWGATGYRTFEVDVSSGERKAMPFGAEHQLLDVSADGRHFLTKRHRARVFGVPGFHDEFVLTVLDREGTIRSTTMKGTKDHAFSDHRLSPDGQSTAALALPQDAAKARTIYAVTSRLKTNPDESVPVFSHYRRDDGDCECRAVAWSPDGKRIVSVWTPHSWKDKLEWHVVVGEVGGTLKTVATIETTGDEQLRTVDWR